MSNPLERRIARLEALKPPKSDKIPVFARNEDHVPKKIEEMIAAGEIAEADRHRCAFYLDIKHEMEWIRQWEDEKLLAEDAARQKAKQEKAAQENAALEKTPHERAEQQQTAPEAAEPQNPEEQQSEPSRSDAELAEPEPAEPHQPEPQQSAPQQSEQLAADGTVPPGCL